MLLTQDHLNLTNLNFPYGYKPLKKLSLHTDIWLCREDASERYLIIKRYPPNLSDEFSRSVRALSNMAQINCIPRLYFAVKCELSIGYLGMEYASGTLFSDWIQKNNSTSRLSLFKSLLEAVAEINSQGFAHCDISPNNILVKNGAGKPQVWLIDWDYSEKINEKNIKTYGASRGTLGYSMNLNFNQPIEAKDLKSLEIIRDLLKLEPLAEERTLWKKIISRKF
jgi:serine/threonine protein kinase